MAEKIVIGPLKPVELGDRERFLAAAKVLNRESCECNFVNIFAWRKRYDSYFTEVNGCLVVLGRATRSLLFPQGEWLEPETLEGIRAELSEQEGVALHWNDVPAEYVAEHGEELRQIFEVGSSEDDADYIYLLKKLARLSGGQHRNTRRLLYQFESSYPDSELKPLGADEGDEVFEFVGKIHEEESLAPYSKNENVALCEAMGNFEALGLEGVKLVDILGNMLAFSMWSYLTDEMVNVHFEKALRSAYGAAQTIRLGVARRLISRAKWLNLEQDLGEPGLRRSKQSYDPHHILERFVLYPRGMEIPEKPNH